MPAVLDERVETPTHRSRRTHQSTGADERKRSVPPAHFIAFMAGAAAFFAFAFTTFIATYWPRTRSVTSTAKASIRPSMSCRQCVQIV